MILHVGERVYWGAPEVIYLEGIITRVDEASQTVTVHIDRATPHSAHLINTDLPFAANGVMPLRGTSPRGTTTEPTTEHQPPRILSPEEKITLAATVAVHQQYGYDLPAEQEAAMIEQIAQTLNNDPAIREHILAAMDEILRREF